MKIFAVLVALLSFNSFALNLNCNLTDQENAQKMFLVGERDNFTLNEFLGVDLKTSLDGGLFKSPYFKDNNYQIEISNECDNFVRLSFYDQEVEKLKFGIIDFIVGFIRYESDSLDKAILSPVRCIKK